MIYLKEYYFDVSVCALIYNKPTDSKQYLPFTSNHPRHFLTNIPFSLTRRICTIVENEKVKGKRFKELKNIARTKIPKSLKEACILIAEKIPLETLRQPKTAKNEEIVPFIFRYNFNSAKVFPIIKASFDNFQYSKTVFNIFQRKKLVKSMSQAPNNDRSLCRSKFESQQKSHELKNCGNHFVRCSYLLKASLYRFKRVNETFLLKNSFNYESSNLIYVSFAKDAKKNI